MSEYHFLSVSEFQLLNDDRNNKSKNFINLPLQPYHQLTTTTVRNPYTSHPDELSTELNVPYTIFEILVAIFAIIGNLMVIIVFQKEKKLRRRTNYYIVSLAIADFLVGLLGVPFAILASVGLPTNLHACLFTVSLLVVLCTISIFCLVAVSIDRYWAILYPMAYSRNVRTKTAIGIISMCWLAGSFVGFLPLLGWHADVQENQACLFVEVMDYNYLVFLYFATIITPALLLLAFYAHIYRVIVKQVRQRTTMNPIGESFSSSRSRKSSSRSRARGNISRHQHHSGGTMLRVLGAARKRDVKATQNLSIIVLFFMICWIPLYTINCIKAFCPDCYVHPKLTFFCIILSHLNSAVNPILYAYHLKDFRAALKNLILKVIGIEVEQPPDLNYRFSLASQHRLQSLIDKRTSSFQNRIYIDSPVWLRQQQNKQEQLAKASSITRSLNSVHQTVAAVASSTTEINRDIWNIIEVPSCADDNSQYNRDIDDNDDDDEDESISGESLSSFPKNDHHNNNNNNNSIDDVQNKLSEQNQSQFLYENRNFSFSLNDLGDGEDDEVFLSPSSIKEIFIINNQTQQEQQQQHQQLNTQNKREKSERKLTKSNSISIDDITTIDNTTAKNENETKMKDCFSQNNRDDTNTIRVHKNENSIYIIENDKSPLSTHRQYYNNKSTVIQKIQSSKIFSPIRMTKSVTVYHQDDHHNDHQHHHDINSNSNNNNCYNNTEKFSPLKTVSNLIFSSAKTSSLFHISENCLESAIRKRRTSADS